MENSLPILIVGAGPTGLIAAIELARRHIPFRLIDKNNAPSDKSKALFLQARTLELFEHIGIIDKILKEAVLPLGETIHVDQKIINFNFAKLQSPYPFGVTLPQAQTETILHRHLEELGASVEWNTELLYLQQKESQVIVSLNKEGKEEVANFSYIIGCDGAHSTVRHALGLNFEGKELKESFALADVIVKGDFEKNRLNMYISDKGLSIIFPLPGNRERVIVSNVDVKKGEELSIERMQQLIAERLCPVIIADPIWLSYFHVNSRHVVKYRVKRIFLAGDAAHIHSPAGGLGMNKGIQDAYNLIWKLAKVYKKEEKESLLDTYEKERLPVAKEVLKTTEKFTKLMTSRSIFYKFLRKYIFPKLIQKNWLQKLFLQKESQLGITYEKSEIVRDYGPRKGFHAGQRFPDFKRLLKGSDYTLLFFTGNQLRKEEIESHQFSIPIVIIEKEIQLRKLLSIKDSAIYLIRPDQYICIREHNPKNLNKIKRFIKN